MSVFDIFSRSSWKRRLVRGRVLIFGGLGQVGLHSPMQIFTINQQAQRPAWRRVLPRGNPPRNAWGHSTHLMRKLSIIMIGGVASDGADWDFHTIHELRLVGNPDGQESSSCSGEKSFATHIRCGGLLPFI